MVNFVPFIGNLTPFVIIVCIFLILILVLLFRRFVTKKGQKSPKMVEKPAEEADKSPPIEKQTGIGVEARPVEPRVLGGLTSLGELAPRIGAKRIIFFNQFGVPIESYNFSEEHRVSALLAEFIFMMRKFDPSFNSTFSENGQRMILLSVERIGEMEVFALTIGDSKMTLKAEEVRDFLRTYLLESLGRSR